MFEVVLRPTPEPENSTLTVVVEAARAGPDFGTNFEGLVRNVCSVAAGAGTDALRAVPSPGRSDVLLSPCDATPPPKNFDNGAIQPEVFVPCESVLGERIAASKPFVGSIAASRSLGAKEGSKITSFSATRI